MKPTTFKTGRLLLLLLTVGLTAGLVSWDHQRAPGHFQQQFNDTTPKKKSFDGDKKIKDLDDVLEELENVDIKVDMQKIKEQVAEALKQVDGEKIKMQIENAMKDVDMEKIQQQIKESLAKVDLEKVKVQLSDAMKELDMSKIQKEIEESMSKVNWDKMKGDMEKLKNIDMKKMEEELEKVKVEMNELGPKMEKEMEKAKIELQKAKEDIREYKAFVDGLDNDGLINKKDKYTLKHKDGELFINGKKASEQTYSKYRNFLEKHKKFNIDKDNEDFDIDID